MSGYSVELTKFGFPEQLDDKKANFRIQVDLRYQKLDGGFALKTVLMPGLELYWECSKKDNQNKRYKPGCYLVRKKDNNGNWSSEVDLRAVGPWGKRFRLQAKSLYELRATVFDVDRKDWWDRFSGAIQSVVGKVLSYVRFAGGVVTPVVEDAASSIGRKLAGGGDKILFVGSAEPASSSSWTIAGVGIQGDYSLSFAAATVSCDSDTPGES